MLRVSKLFSVKGWTINILGWAGHMVSVWDVAGKQPQTTGGGWVWLCSNKTLFTKTGTDPGVGHAKRLPK